MVVRISELIFTNSFCVNTQHSLPDTYTAYPTKAAPLDKLPKSSSPVVFCTGSASPVISSTLTCSDTRILSAGILILRLQAHKIIDGKLVWFDKCVFSV